MISNKRFSALIADESRSMLINLKEVLKNKFLCEQIVPCRDGAKAWENLQKLKFDLILSNAVLPGISGEELLCNVRENAEKKYSFPYNFKQKR